MYQRCLYVGAAYDFESATRLPFIKEWIFIDTLPDTEGGEEISVSIQDDSDERYDDKLEELLRSDIVMRREFYFKYTKETGKKYGFNFVSDDPLASLMTFTKEDVTVYLFYNTYFPRTKNPALERLLPGTDSIYIQGFDPTYNIELTPNLNTVFFSQSTQMIPRSFTKMVPRMFDTETPDIVLFLYLNYVEGLKYAVVEQKTYKDPKDLTYCINALDCHHKSMTNKSGKDYLKYVYNRDPKGYYLTENRHYSTKRKRIELVRARGLDGSTRHSAKSRKTRHRKSRRGSKKSRRKSRK